MKTIGISSNNKKGTKMKIEIKNMKCPACGGKLIIAEYVSGPTSDITSEGYFCEVCNDWVDDSDCGEDCGEDWEVMC